MAEEITIDDLRTVNYDHYVTLISISTVVALILLCPALIVLAAILYYDYFLTIAEERERVWKTGKLSWASGLFYANRYLSMFGHVPVMIEFFWSTSNPNKMAVSWALSARCHTLQTFHQYLAVVTQLVVACMLVMRVYALYERSRYVLGLYIFVVSSALAVGCWSLLDGKASEPTRDVYLPSGCGPNLTHHYAIRLAIAWAGMLFFDILVFAMTLYKSLTLPRITGRSLLSVLFRDGAIYFGVIATSNLANILTFLFGTAFTRGVLTTFTNVISSVMLSRLVLNLRHPSLVSNARHTSQPNLSDDLAYPRLSFTGDQGTTEILEGDSIHLQNIVRRPYHIA